MNARSLKHHWFAQKALGGNSPASKLVPGLSTKNAPDTKGNDGADSALQQVRNNFGQRGFSVGDTEKTNGFGKQGIKKSFKDKVSGDQNNNADYQGNYHPSR